MGNMCTATVMCMTALSRESMSTAIVMCMAAPSKESMSMVPAGLRAVHGQENTVMAEAAIIPGIIPEEAEAITNLFKMNA